MTKAEAIAKIKAALKEAEIKKAEDTVQNIETKVVDDVKAADVTVKETPVAAEIEKAVANAEEPLVAADKDGVSKNGGEAEMTKDSVEAEKKKEDNAMKDVINVAGRKVEENTEVQAELLKQLEEAASREEGYKAKIAEINTLCEEALEAQRKQLLKAHGVEMTKFFEAIVAKGEAFEAELTEAAAKNEKAYKSAKKLYESSLKMNKMLLEAVKKAQPAKAMTRYVTPARRALESVK
mgnify:CR=1 FL=1|jgi:hypothetical protein